MVMNATRTTLSDVLWRWQRGIARACRRRHDGAVVPDGKRGLSPVIAVIAALSLLLPAIPAQSAAPTFVGVSGTNSTTAAASTGADVTVTLPAHQAGDILLLIGVVRDQDDTVTVSGWTQMTGSPFNRSTVSRYWVFWKRAASSSETNPVFDKNTTTGDTFVAVASYRGAIGTGDPWEVKGTPATGTSDPATCSTGINTLTDASLVVVALAGEDNNNASVTTTGTNPAAYNEHYLESPTGNDGMIAFSEAERTTAGATGPVSVNFNTANPVGWGCMVLALKPSVATLSSAANQTFTLGDPPTVASTLTVTDASTPTITASNNLRIRIPATFSMTWDTAVTTVTLGGGAAGKVSATLLAYEDSNKTAVLDVTSNFAASDQLTISGLKFRDFTTTEAADNLELVVAGSGGATASTDDKTITIVDSDVRSAGSRILNDNAGRTPVAAEDVDVTNWNKSTKFLVTIGIQTRSGSGARCEAGQGTNRLQWRNVTDAPGTWNNLGTATGPEMILFNSANLVDDNSLTSAEAQIVGTGTYINGKEAENNNDKSWSRFEDGDHSAIQFAIDPSGGIDGKTYQFRFVVNGSLCDAGSNVMSVSITLATAPPPPVAGGFNAYETSTAAGAVSGVIKTKIAGSTISLDVIALNAAKTAIETTFTGTVRVEVLNASDNSGALDGNGCRPTWTVIQTLSPDPTFVAGDNGRKTISFTQANSFPNARLRITFPAGAPTVTGCSSDNFAIRPNTFASFAVTDTDWQTAGTVRTLDNTGANGGNVHKAGLPFTVRADAVNGAGTPAVTTNYTGTPTLTLSDCGGMPACPAALGTVTLGASFVAGVLTANTASYSEVGSFALQLVDDTFSSVDAADGSTPAERNIVSSTINVGRFVPDHFDVTAVTAPVFRTFDDAACATRSFTYIGQRFGYATTPAAMIAAKNSSGGTTTNYTGALWKLTNASASQTFANSPVIALDTAGISAPTVSETAGTGTGTFTANASDAIAFVRDTASPQAPFNANLSLTISVSDATEAGASQGTITTGAPLVFNGVGSGIAFDSGNAMRYGRLVIRNANGSQLVPLPVQVEAQYWSGAPTNAFITNTQDNCTTIAAANDAMGNYTGNLSGSPTCETAVSGGGTLSAGRRTLQLAAPGSGNNGSVDLTVNLGTAASGTTCTTVGGAPVAATTANLPHLQGNWTGGAYNVNPSARATFGVFKGAEEVIFQRENF